jgi:hypothetical protein
MRNEFFKLKFIFLLCFGLSNPSSKVFCQNLVLNPSFENLIQCPEFPGSIDFAENWTSPNTGSSNILGLCNSSQPNSNFGFQHPHQGENYSGIFVFEANDYKEYIQGEFSQPLKSNTNYKVKYFVSLADSISTISIRTFGFYTSNEQIHTSDYFHLPFTPQIIADPTGSSMVKEWIPMEGTFVAKGGEKYLTIGNFSPDSLSDTTAVNEINNPALFYRLSYFFIDDVSVEEIKSELDLNMVSITNSLTSDFFSIKYLTNNRPQLRVQLLDGVGRLIKELSISENINITVDDLSTGIYYCRILNQKEIVLIDKIVKVH